MADSRRLDIAYRPLVAAKVIKSRNEIGECRRRRVIIECKQRLRRQIAGEFPGHGQGVASHIIVNHKCPKTARSGQTPVRKLPLAPMVRTRIQPRLCPEFGQKKGGPVKSRPYELRTRYTKKCRALRVARLYLAQIAKR